MKLVLAHMDCASHGNIRFSTLWLFVVSNTEFMAVFIIIIIGIVYVVINCFLSRQRNAFESRNQLVGNIRFLDIISYLIAYSNVVIITIGCLLLFPRIFYLLVAVPTLYFPPRKLILNINL